VWSSTDELADAWQLDRRFDATMDAETRQRLRNGWREAVDRSKGWTHITEGA
jgi:glycerol kinase